MLSQLESVSHQRPGHEMTSLGHGRKLHMFSGIKEENN